jgi:RNA polymerase sigma-70 factor (ECF subfamily)
MVPMNPTESWKAFTREPAEETFGPLYESTKRLVWTLCARLLRNHEDASDAFQSAYSRLLAIARDPALAREVEDAGGTLCRLAVREADALRKRRARRAARETVLDEEAIVKAKLPPPEEAAARREVRDRVEALVEELPERYRLPVQLHFFHGLSQREVARALGEPLATVAGRIQTALRKLDPACRRAGLRGAGAALAGLAAGGALLEPPFAAAAVLARAEASAAAVAASVATTTVILTGGLLAVKAKVAVAITILAVLALGGALFHREISGLIRPAERATVAVAPTPEPAAPPPAAPATADETPAPAVAPAAVPVAGSVTGLVTDSVTGEPIPGATIRVRPQGRLRSTPEDPRAVADERGAYALRGLGEGVHEVTASAEGRADRQAEVKMDGSGESIQDFALDPGMSVLVTVVGEDGRPIAGARAVPSDPNSDAAFYTDRGADTDESGQAWLHKLNRIRPPRIAVYKDGYRSPTLRPQARPDSDSAEVKFVIERIEMKARAIAGSVRDASGRPIEGATIEWKDGAGTAYGKGAVYGQHRAVTGRDGRYRLEYDDDYHTCDLGVAAPGWAPVVARGVRPGTPEEPAEKDFTLEPGHWLAGRVVDEESRPLPGVRIHVMPSLDLLNPAVAYPAVLRAVKTDEEGRFRLEDLPGPRAAVEIWPADRRPSKEIEVEVDREVDLVLEGHGVIRGRVVDAVTGEPVQVFSVRRNLESPGVSFTDAGGRFSLDRLPVSSETKVAVDAIGYISLELALTARPEGQAEEATFALQRGLALEGVVVDAETGAPLAGIPVLATTSVVAEDFLSLDWDSYRHNRDNEKVVTGDDGVFRFLEDKAKPATLIVRASGRRRVFIVPGRRAAFVLPDGRLRIPLERAERLRGVFFLGGRPTPEVEVSLYLPGTAEAPAVEGQPVYQAVAETDADGKFAWDDLAPGSHVLTATLRAREPARDFEVKVSRQVVVKPGEEAAVELGKDLGDLTLRGRVAGMEGRESVWAGVSLKPLGGGGDELYFMTYRDRDWRFVCPYLRQGKYAVEVRFYVKEGTGTATLPAIEVTGDAEQDLEVPADGG